LSIVLPNEWLDVTQDRPSSSPATLARPDGIGALQFSTAKYRSGARPNVTREDLKELLVEFFVSRQLGQPANVREREGKMLSLSGDFDGLGEFIRTWYLTNGRDVVLATYVTQESKGERVLMELSEAETIVASISIA
jgi:hypothetical protein